MKTKPNIEFIKIQSADKIPKREEYEHLLKPVWSTILYPNTVVLLVGAPKAGKSTLLYSWLGALARGEAWAGIAPQRPLNVLYCDLENPEAVQWDKINTYAEKEKRFNHLTIDWERITNLAAPLFSMDLLKLKLIDLRTKEWWPDIVAIDPFGEGFELTEENKAREMIVAIRQCKVIARRLKTIIILAHHTRKPPPGSRSWDDPRHASRGSSALPGAVDVQINCSDRLNADGSECAYMETVLSRFGGRDKPCFEVYFNTDGQIIEVLEVSKNRPLTPSENHCLRLITPHLPATEERVVSDLVASEVILDTTVAKRLHTNILSLIGKGILVLDKETNILTNTTSYT